MEEERDRFLCAYNLLLRFSDSISLSEGNLIRNEKGNFMHIRTTKTGERVLIPLMARTMAILERNDFKIPHITNQESNWKLKDLGSLAKINQPVTVYEHREGKIFNKTVPKFQLISTHTSRRSGATNMWRAGVPIKVIMDLGGWTSEEAFRKYLKISKQESAYLAAGHEFFK